MSEVRPIVRVSVDEVPLLGPSVTVSYLAREVPEGTAGRPEEGWQLHSGQHGIHATKGDRVVCVPWSRVRLIEFGPLEQVGTKK
jgi:hypothetical protein